MYTLLLTLVQKLGPVTTTKSVGAAQTNYIYDLDGNVISELDQNAGWLNVYLRMNGMPLAQYTLGQPRTAFILGDHLGSTRVLTKYDATIVDSLDYLPFGEQVLGGSTTTHKFTGDERDAETGFDQTWFRKYSSNLGSWMTPDPAGLAAVDPSNPQSWNRYAFVLNNPVANVDPLGLDYCPENGAGGCAWQIDGVDVSESQFYSALQADAAAVCPDNDCTGIKIEMGPGGLTIIKRWVPTQVWSTGSVAGGDPMIHMITGGWKNVSVTYEDAGDHWLSTFGQQMLPWNWTINTSQGSCLAVFGGAVSGPLKQVQQASGFGSRSQYLAPTLQSAQAITTEWAGAMDSSMYTFKENWDRSATAVFSPNAVVTLALASGTRALTATASSAAEAAPPLFLVGGDALLMYGVAEEGIAAWHGACKP